MNAWLRLKSLSAFGAPVFVHRSVFIAVGLLLLIALGNPIYAILAIVAYLGIIFGHEIGHALVAHRLGYRVDSIGVTFWHGWCRCEEPDTEWEHALIAWGGAAAQLTLALPVLIAAVVFRNEDWGYFTPIIVVLGYLNVVWAVANVLPGDDTDGRVAWRVVPLAIEARRARRAERQSARSGPWRR